MSQTIETQLKAKLQQLQAQHVQNLEAIGKIQLLSSYGRKLDVAGTQEIHKKHTESENARYNATHNGIEAFERLLTYAETRRSGQIQRIAQFLAGAWGVAPGLKLDCLLSLDKSIGDDMLHVLNAIRWNVVAVFDLAIDGRKRVPAALRAWGYEVQ